MGMEEKNRILESCLKAIIITFEKYLYLHGDWKTVSNFNARNIKIYFPILDNDPLKSRQSC